MIFIFIILAIIVMTITWFVMFHTQYETIDKNILQKLNTLQNSFMKRRELLKKVILLDAIKNCTDSELQQIAAKVLQQLDSISNRDNSSNRLNISNTITYEQTFSEQIHLLQQYLKENSNLSSFTQTNDAFQNLLQIEEDLEDEFSQCNHLLVKHNVMLKMFPSSIIGKIDKRTAYPIFTICLKKINQN